MSALTALLDITKTTGAFAVLGGAALTVANYTELRPVVVKEFKTVQMQLDELSRAQLYQRFWLLSEKRKREPLSTEELLDMCRIANALEFKIVIQDCK